VKKRLVVLIAALPALFASPAAGSVTLGQLAPGVSPPGYLDGQCGGPVPGDYLQQTVSAGNSFVVPGPGVITSWSHNAGDGTGMTLTFKVFRHFGGALFTAVGHSGPFPLLPSTINTFPTNIPVSGGDIIGLRIPTATAGVACDADVPGEPGELTTATDLADGQSGGFAPSAPFYRVNVTAVFQPSNSFTLGQVTRNVKKGTASVSVDVPNPGELTVSGKGVKAASAGARIATTVSAPGTATVTIRAKGKQRKTLNSSGKVKVKPLITYTPTGGDALTQQLKVKLRKR
jgi:hypothetical protein